MGLTFLAFVSALLLFLMVPAVLRRGRSSTPGIVVALVDLLLGFFSLFHGLVTVTAGLGESPVALAFSRLSAASLFASLIFLFMFALSFPEWLGTWAKVLSAIVAAASLVVVWMVLATDSFMTMIFGVVDDAVRFGGQLYGLISNLTAAAALLAALINLLRGILTKDMIHRQRSIVATVGVSLGIAGIWLFSRGIGEARGPSVSLGVVRTYVLLPLPALLIGAATSYALILSRIFAWSVVVRRFLSYSILTLVFGLPAGAAVSLLIVMGGYSILVPLIGTPLVFIAARAWAASFAASRLERMTLLEYREELESGLSHIDLALGRDAVLAEVQLLLGSALDFVEFAVLIEDEHGVYRTIHSASGKTASLGRGERVHEVVEASGVTVLLRSETLASAQWQEVRDELLGFFDLFHGEAMIFAREGQRIIGAFILGARRSGGDYTDYDYESFKAIYGKLFVIAYYLKNVARESILYTVSRELALSDQVVRFALEKVDRIEDPNVDIAWSTRSTRSLGGDFIDFVRISRQRWFFVLGDVSGKGLSASMNMLILKSMVRSFLRVERDFSGLVQRVNVFIKDNLPRGTFFAGIFGYFDFEKNALYFINCGVPTLLLYAPSFDAFIEVQGEGKILGFVRDVSAYLKPRKLSLPPGSLLV
ncbi:MAG: PP2C family protein-serine/threonine phosphatase, partial [Spirochaetota bacterium]